MARPRGGAVTRMQPPVACPVCGAYSLTQDGQSSVLLAVCDVLVLKALEKIGARIVRASRARHGELQGCPLHLAHTIWPNEDEDTVSRVLRGAWDVVPAILSVHSPQPATAESVTAMLDSYVRDLVITGHAHEIEELCYRFDSQLNLPVWLKGQHLPTCNDRCEGDVHFLAGGQVV